jgi:hypothetical protein
MVWTRASKEDMVQKHNPGAFYRCVRTVLLSLVNYDIVRLFHFVEYVCSRVGVA